MCSGVAEDNNIAPGWMAYVTQDPNKKVGYGDTSEHLAHLSHRLLVLHACHA